MKNVLDSANYPDDVPAELVAGSFWAWKRPDISEVYEPDRFTVSLNLLYQDDPQITFAYTANKIDGAHVFEETGTGGVTPGLYRWQLWVERDSDSVTVLVDEGFVTVQPGDAAAPSYTYRVLVAIRATIEGSASSEQASISFGGRTLTSRNLGELMQLEREFSRRWSEERAAIERKAGRRPGKRVLVKMGA